MSVIKQSHNFHNLENNFILSEFLLNVERRQAEPWGGFHRWLPLKSRLSTASAFISQKNLQKRIFERTFLTHILLLHVSSWTFFQNKVLFPDIFFKWIYYTISRVQHCIFQRSVVVAAFQQYILIMRVKCSE